MRSQRKVLFPRNEYQYLKSLYLIGLGLVDSLAPFFSWRSFLGSTNQSSVTSDRTEKTSGQLILPLSDTFLTSGTHLQTRRRRGGGCTPQPATRGPSRCLGFSSGSSYAVHLYIYWNVNTMFSSHFLSSQKFGAVLEKLSD